MERKNPTIQGALLISSICITIIVSTNSYGYVATDKNKRVNNINVRILGDATKNNGNMRKYQELEKRTIIIENDVKNIEKHIEENSRWIESEQKNIEWWFQFLGYFSAVVGILIALAGIGFPLFLSKRQSERNNRAIQDIERIKIDALHNLERIKHHRDHARELKTDIEDMLSELELGPPDVEQTDEQKKVIEKISKDSTAPAETLLRALALKHHGNKDWVKAVAYWEELAKLIDDAEVYFYMGFSYSMIWEESSKVSYLDKSIEAYTKSLELGESINVYMNLANALSDRAEENEKPLINFAKADIFYQKVTELDPEDTDVYINWAKSLYRQSLYEEGEDSKELLEQSENKLNTAMENDPDNPEVFTAMGHLCLIRGLEAEGEERDKLFQKSEDMFKRSILINEKNSESYKDYATALYMIGRDKKADEKIQYIDRALRNYNIALKYSTENERGKIFLYLGSTYLEKGNISPKEESVEYYKNALEYLNESLGYSEDSVETKNAMMITLLKLSYLTDKEKQKELQEEAERYGLEIETKYPGKGSYNLACVYSLLGKERKVIQWLENSVYFGVMPDCEHMRKDKDLESVRDKDWFKDFLKEYCQ